MLYRIERTSDWFGENKPCANAFLYKKGNKEFAEPNTWRIEIKTLDEMHDLIREVGSYIILKSERRIEIYDDYRE